MQKIESKLGFDRIREFISARCSTEYARGRVADEEITTFRETIRRRLGLTDEMRVIMMFESSFPGGGFVDAIPFLAPLRGSTSYIDLYSLGQLRTSLDLLRKLLHFFDNCEAGKYPLLREMSSGVLSFPEVLRRIDHILDKFGEVRDNASEDLAVIRRSIREKEGVISKRMQSILRHARAEGLVDEDATVSVRDGKMLIPVAAGNKNKISGIVYDESASGRTSFIEPIEIVELNNRLRELHFEEQREIIRILTEFTDFLRPYIDEIIEAHQYMGEVDFIMAKAQVATRFRAGMPILSENGELILRKARHPLLEEALTKEGKQIVPLDITLNSHKRILLISGPNAGGKSVCLKTAGLLQYMFQWGMLIPAAESSELTVFTDFFVDIGDNQSIENDLSTYSSHLYNMKNIVLNATEHCFVLIDEFGSGTEPAAGGAIAEEILSEIEQRGCYGIITTHYTNLKFYANNSTSVVNGAMLFDTQNIKPFFKLEIGLPGNSFAFELARKIGLPESIVHGAEERAGKDYVTIERNLRKIARNKRELEERLTRVKAADKTLDSMTDKYEKELADIKKLRKSILEEAKAQAAQIIAEANKKIEHTIREIRESQAEKTKTQELRKDLRDFVAQAEAEAADKEAQDIIERKMAQIIERKRRQAERKARKGEKTESAKSAAPVVENTPKAPEITVGTHVRFASTGLVGEVVQISGKKATVAVGDVLTKTPIAGLEPITSNQFKAASKPAAVKSSVTASISERKLNFKPSIDIRGMRLEEAITTVTHFIDDAMMVGMSEVSILHGKGTGVLKEEIRKYLRITPGVASFGDEHVQRGGSGITIVKLD